MGASREQVDAVALEVVEALKAHHNVKVVRPEAAVSTVRRILTESFRIEDELEAEALSMLRQHNAQILNQGADFQRMLREGKKALARKRGIVL